MECEKCGHLKRVANLTFESEEGSTEVYSVQHIICVNQDCANATAGLIEFVRNKLN